MNTPIVITSGEPAGIGPDLCVMAAQRRWQQPFVVLGDPELLISRAQLLGLPLTIHTYLQHEPVAPAEVGHLYVEPVNLEQHAEPGRLNSKNASYVLSLLKRATRGCQQNQYAAMITAPVHKGVINDSGISFSGHTEYLAELTATQQVVMMLATKQLRVALATTHLPLSEVPKKITPALLNSVLKILHRELIDKFNIANPQILVCGLNPHAGENGHLGREEIEVIEPTLLQLRSEGINLIGPLPADTLFTPKHLEQADAVLAMYHDQGLPVLKFSGFGQAINITLGLPIIRTSVDHGTALDLAATGKADPSSLYVAMEYAQRLADASLMQTTHTDG